MQIIVLLPRMLSQHEPQLQYNSLLCKKCEASISINFQFPTPNLKEMKRHFHMNNSSSQLPLIRGMCQMFLASLALFTVTYHIRTASSRTRLRVLLVTARTETYQASASHKFCSQLPHHHLSCKNFAANQ